MPKALGADYVGDDPDDPFSARRVNDLRRELLGPRRRSGSDDVAAGIGSWIAGIGGLLIVAFYVAIAVGFVWAVFVPHHAGRTVVRPAPRTEHAVTYKQYLEQHGGIAASSGTVPSVCNSGRPGTFAAQLAAAC